MADLKADELGRFLERVSTLPPADQADLKRRFFEQRISVDPGWASLRMHERVLFAKEFGAEPWQAVTQRDVAGKEGGQPLGQELQHPPGLLGGLISGDPVDYLTGGILGASPRQLAQGLTSGNPMLRQALTGAMKGAADWGTSALWRVPGAVGRRLPGALQELARGEMPGAARPRPMPPQPRLPGGIGAPLALPPVGGTTPATSPFPMGPSPRLRFRFGPNGLEPVP